MKLFTDKSATMGLYSFSGIGGWAPLLAGLAVTLFLGGNVSATPLEGKGTKPSWTNAGAHPSYLPPRYVQGVGVVMASKDPAIDRQIADQNAFSEIARQISAEVSTEFSVEKMEIAGDKVETLLERASSGARVRSSVTLSGLVIVERYYDPQEKIYYSLGVVDRISASDPYLQKLQRSVTDWQTYLKSAEEYKQQGKTLQAILSLRDAYRAASQYQESLPAYQLLAGPTGQELEIWDQLPEPSPAIALESLSAILASLHLQIEKGNGQAYIHNKPLPDPLVVRLAAGAHAPLPAEGFTVEFRFRSGQGDVFPMTAKTDSQGRALTSVSNIEPTPDENYSITAMLDFAELLDTSQYREDWNSRIPQHPVSILFTLEKKKAEAKQVAVLIADKSTYQGRPTLMRNALASRLSQMGFKAVSNNRLDKIFASDEGDSWEALRKWVPKNVEIVILGEIADTSVNLVLGVFVCSLSGSINAIDVKSGKILTTQAMEAIRGFGVTEVNARNDAYKNAGTEMAEAFISDFLNGNGTAGSH